MSGPPMNGPCDCDDVDDGSPDAMGAEEAEASLDEDAGGTRSEGFEEGWVEGGPMEGSPPAVSSVRRRRTAVESSSNVSRQAAEEETLTEVRDKDRT